jgi:hypothetical protein
MKSTLLISLFLIASTPGAVSAVGNGNPICTASDRQWGPDIVPSAAGGAYVVWSDYRSGSNTDIYYGQVSAGGSAHWPDGIGIHQDLLFGQNRPVIASDGAGNVMIAWEDLRGGAYADVYAQSLNHQGVRWPGSGVPVCTVVNDQKNLCIVSDDVGGAIVAWEDFRSGGPYIYAQRVDYDGPQWAPDGVGPLGSDRQFQPIAVSDRASGAIVIWYDEYSDIYAQRISASGVMEWGVSGVPICNATGEQWGHCGVSDGFGGVIVAWCDGRNGGVDIYAQRVSSSGTMLWDENGIALCTAPGDQLHPVITSDGAEGAIVAWDDDQPNVSLQRVDATGAVQFATDGIKLSSTASRSPRIVSDGEGGAIVAWEDDRFWDYTATDIYAQRVSSTGVAQWNIDGTPLCTANRSQYDAALIPDGFGGAFVTWTDLRASPDASNPDIYALRILVGGQIPSDVEGDRAPSLVVGDVYPNPFSAQASLDFVIRDESPIAVELFDVAGRRVRAVMRGVAAPGPSRITIDARDQDARLLPSGVYFGRVQAGTETVIRKVVIAR